MALGPCQAIVADHRETPSCREKARERFGVRGRPLSGLENEATLCIAEPPGFPCIPSVSSE